MTLFMTLFKPDLNKIQQKNKHHADDNMKGFQYLWAMQTSPATILVIEKHPLMRAAILNAIVDEPDLTIAAITANGQDTLQIIESLRPHIILFAIGNPGDEDLKTLQELHKRAANTAFLALVTSEVPGQDQAALEHGADAALSKTAPRAELLHTLRMMKAYYSQRSE